MLLLKETAIGENLSQGYYLDELSRAKPPQGGKGLFCLLFFVIVILEDGHERNSIRKKVEAGLTQRPGGADAYWLAFDGLLVQPTFL